MACAMGAASSTSCGGTLGSAWRALRPRARDSRALFDVEMGSVTVVLGSFVTGEGRIVGEAHLALEPRTASAGGHEEDPGWTQGAPCSTLTQLWAHWLKCAERRWFLRQVTSGTGVAGRAARWLATIRRMPMIRKLTTTFTLVALGLLTHCAADPATDDAEGRRRRRCPRASTAPTASRCSVAPVTSRRWRAGSRRTLRSSRTRTTSRRASAMDAKYT